MSSRRITTSFAAMAAVAAIVSVIYACATPLSPADVKIVATNFDPVSSLQFSATVGTTLSNQPVVRAKDKDGDPMPDVTVNFVSSQDPQPTPSTVSTKEDGTAAPTTWTLPTAVGTVTLTATPAGTTLPPRTFTVTLLPDVAASGSKVAGDNQTAIAGSAVAVQPKVKVVDQYGNPVPNVAVTFAVTAGGGTVVPATAVNTDAAGTVQTTSWTLGGTAGANTLRATIAGVAAPLTFSATGTAGTAKTIVIAPPGSSQGQTAIAGNAVANAPSVLVQDANNNPVAGVTVRFAVATGGGKLFASSSDATGSATLDVATNASGIATAFAWKLGTVGSNTLSVTVPSVSSVAAFTITATATTGPPASITILSETPSSNNQTAYTGTSVPVPPAVIVKDANGNPVSGVSVDFVVGASSGTIQGTSTSAQAASATIVTNANGVARLYSWTLSATAGANTLTATVTANSSLTVSFTANSVTRKIPANIAIFAGDGQTGTVATTLATAPAVQVTDSSGAPVGGLTVRFTVSGGNGQVSESSVITDVNGVAQPAFWKLGTVAGTQTLIATAIDSSAFGITLNGSTGGTLNAESINGNPVVFTATATAGPAAQVEILWAPFSVRDRLLFDPTVGVQVADAYGNAVAQGGVAITAAIDGTGATLQGTTTVTTDAGGFAEFTDLSLSGTAGVRNLTLTTASFPVASTPIQLIGGLPATIAVNAGDAQSAVQLTTLPTNPSVKVLDADGNPVEGVVVRFAVTGGNGQIAQSAAATDANGIAGTSWSLGVIPGAQALTATAESDGTGAVFTGSTSSGTLGAQKLTGNPVVFNATATLRAACSTTTAITLGGSAINGSLNASTSCLRNFTGDYLPTDAYTVTTTAAQTNFALTLTSSAFGPRLVTFGWPPSGVSYTGTDPSPLTMLYFVKPGTYSIYATESTMGSGAYTLTSTTNPTGLTGCLNAIVSTGISVTHSLDANCNYTQGSSSVNAASKRYLIFVPGGQTLNVSVQSSSFNPKIELYQVSGTNRYYVSSASGSGVGSTASITGAGGYFYEIRVTHVSSGTALTGAYTMTIAP